MELLQQKLESNIELFCVQAVKIHSKLDMIDIEQIMLEEGLTISDDSFMGAAGRPVSDLAFAKVEPEMTKALGYSLHSVAKDCLKIESI